MGFIRKNRSLGFLSLAVTLAALTGSAATVWIGASWESYIASGDYIFWLLLAPVLSVLMAAGFVPSTLASLFSGYFLGWYSLIFLVPVYLLASFSGFFFTKRIDRGRLAGSLKESPVASEILKGIRKNEASMVFFSRLSPALPFALMNIVLTGTGVKLRNYLVAGAVGMLPRTCLAVYIAGFAKELKLLLEQGHSISWESYSLVFLFILSFAGMIILLRKSVKAAISAAG